MDAEKVAFLFDDVPAWADPDDLEDRGALLAARTGLIDDDSAPALFRSVVYETIATQIAEEDPPEVWATARRLGGLGLDRETVLRNLSLALIPALHAALDKEEPLDPATYVQALDRLPLPGPADVETAMVALVRERQPIGIEELEELTAAAMGFSLDEQPYQLLLDKVSDRTVAPDGPLALLAGDRVVEPATLCAGVVLTHRLNDTEHDIGILTVSVDLAGFTRTEEPMFGEQALEPFSVDEGHLAWGNRDGWLDRFAVDDLLAVRVDPGGSVTIEVLDDQPAIDAELVAAVRASYDREVEEPGLPVSVEDVLLGVAVEDRSRFHTPQAPLRDLLEAAGLELRAGYVAHDQEIWDRERTGRRMVRLGERLPATKDVERALDVLALFDSGEPDPEKLRGAAHVLTDPDILEAVAAELLDEELAEEGPEDAAAVAERLALAARGPTDIAAARFLAALACERAGDVLAAEAHLHLAVGADSDWAPAADRLAWYLADRGRAADAVRLWRSAGLVSKANQDLRMAESFARTGTAKIGRNQPCWCGSGRKYKQCHLGEPVTAPLPDRVGWLCRKAAAYLERYGAEADEDVFELAGVRAGAGAGTEELRLALSDPVVVDLALTEGGWFARFLEDRGPLLPDDEALLAASWLLVDRSVYEVVDVRAGSGLTIRDLRTAEVVEVRERTFSRQAQPGELLCGRPVPDGESHQMVGAIFGVRAGREAELLDLLDEGDPEELAAYIGSLEQPPLLRTRENEPLVECRAVLAAVDPDAVRKVLDARYEPEEPGTWTEMHALDDDESILRATLRLKGGRLTVETMSEPRLDRVLGVLRQELPDLRLESEGRRPLDPGELPTPPRVGGGAPAALADPAVIEEISDRLERRWCDEAVPALAGLTPRQAAADPSRREALDRLLAEFERVPTPPGAFTLRPDRLRRLLGIG